MQWLDWYRATFEAPFDDLLHWLLQQNCKTCQTSPKHHSSSLDEDTTNRSNDALHLESEAHMKVLMITNRHCYTLVTDSNHQLIASECSVATVTDTHSIQQCLQRFWGALRSHEISGKASGNGGYSRSFSVVATPNALVLPCFQHWVTHSDCSCWISDGASNMGQMEMQQHSEMIAVSHMSM